MENKPEAAKPQDKDMSKKKAIIIGVVAIVLAIVAVILIVCLANGNKDGGTGTGDDSSQAEENNAKKWVGKEGFGFVEVPESWSVIQESDEDGLQYGSSKTSTQGYFVSLLVQDSSKIDVDAWIEGLKEVFELANVSDTKVEKKKLAVGEAQVISGYYEAYSRWMAAYVFSTDDGKTHYVSIEGPDKDNEAFKIPETFKLNK